jgi:hypothetical protein
MSRVASAGAHSLFIGDLPAHEAVPVPFGELAHRLKEERGVLLLGLRNPATGADRLNPPDELPVSAGTQLIYLAEDPLAELPQPTAET